MSSTGAGPSPTQWPNLSDAIVRGFGLSSSSGRWDFSNPPFGFGPLNALHATALMGHPLSLSLRVVLLYAVVPLFPLYLQAFLLLGEQSRRIRALRMALGGAAVAGIVKAWLSFRFTEPRFNAFNNGITICYLHLLLKAVEFALLQDKVVDPWMKRGRSRFIAATDLCCNSRMLFLGSVGLDDQAGSPNATVHKPAIASYFRHLVPADSELRPPTHTARRARLARRNSVERFNSAVNEMLSPSPSPGSTPLAQPSQPPQPPQEPTPLQLPPQTTRRRMKPRWIPAPIYLLWTRRPSSRPGAIARHLLHACTHYSVLDTFLIILRRTAQDLNKGGEGVLEKYALAAKFVGLPGVLDGRFVFNVPPGLLAICVEISVPIVIWQGLNFGYHVFAILALCGGWEVQSWDVDLFDAPWRADSLIDLWGRRWHQLFRHQFILASASTLKLLNLPNIPATLFPLVFIFSCLLHVLGELSMSPVPAPLAIGGFFLLSGLGCVLEVAFKAATGRRVRGASGRLWCWTFTFVIGRLAADAWLDAAIAGCTMLPAGGVGEYIAPLVVGRLFAQVD